MTMRIQASALAIAVSMVAASAKAEVLGIPGVTYTGSIQTEANAVPDRLDDSSSQDLQDINSGGFHESISRSATASAQATLSTTLGPSPRISANVSISSSAAYVGAVVQERLTYGFIVTGPAPTVLVQMDALGSIYGSGAKGDTYSYGALSANLYLTEFRDDTEVLTNISAYAGAQLDGCSWCGGELWYYSHFSNLSSVDGSGNSAAGMTERGDSFSTSFRENGFYQLDTNHLYMVYMEVNGDITTSGSAISASVFLDPRFSIAPSVANADAYSFALSEGVGNSLASGVPEPGTWAMMMVGFAGIGVAGYRRRDISDRTRIRAATAANAV